ncbi:MAG: hypothetical protein MUC77_20935 [Chromatiaceae bacterium]|jgi:hypothetical protein|nr:hypothetical protein [Chromatiaceae bacterium]
MSGSNGHGRLLIGRKAITGYLQIGDPMFYEFIKLGMPARVINNRWYAHTDNIDLFFKQITIKGTREAPEGAE